jgi:hypothetical protein
MGVKHCGYVQCSCSHPVAQALIHVSSSTSNALTLMFHLEIGVALIILDQRNVNGGRNTSTICLS